MYRIIGDSVFGFERNIYNFVLLVQNIDTIEQQRVKAICFANKKYQKTTLKDKVLFINPCIEQNFCPSLWRLVDRLYTVIHKTPKTRTKVLPYATVGE